MDIIHVDIWKNLYRVLALLNRGLQSNLNTCVQYIHIFQMELAGQGNVYYDNDHSGFVNTKCFTKTKSVIFNIHKCLLVSSQRLFEDDNI